ncbi:MAG: hypothetical protein ABJF01_17530 [bacterium]
MATDLSGRPIPGSSGGTGPLSRMVAVPPVRQVPNEVATEFLLTAYANLAAGGATFVPLTDPSTAAAFGPSIPDRSRARIDALTLYCPDMIAAAAPYLFASLAIGQQLASAWGFIPIYPRNGVASIAFDTVIDVAPGQRLGLSAENTDPANTHFLAVYLHGWFWPSDYVDG